MLYRFTGEAPELFPTVTVSDGDSPRAAGILQPGAVVDVVTVDSNEGGLVIHPRLQPADPACERATADLQAWVDALNDRLAGRAAAAEPEPAPKSEPVDATDETEE